MRLVPGIFGHCADFHPQLSLIQPHSHCRGQNTKMLSAIIRDLIFEQPISSEPQPNQRVAYMTNMSRQILGRSVVVRSQGVHSLG